LANYFKFSLNLRKIYKGGYKYLLMAKEINKSRVNFTISTILMKKFRSYCEEHHLKMSQVVEKLIKWELGADHADSYKDEKHSGIL
jgi:hypothetical protein